tara:strand:- start:784 stop:1350 length:567 start_codon:yes stop_codon:yes gene_type:complete
MDIPKKNKLIYLLQNAHAGEKAAAFAYNGHHRSLKNPIEIADLKKIEDEELDHRHRLHAMLLELESGPRPSRERLMSLVGKTISFLCILGGYLNIFNFGWFMSMYGAGKLEAGNVVEYEVAAQMAVDAGYPQFVASLLNMAEIEWDHELYFRNKSLESGWAKWISIWPKPPPRELIQRNYLKYSAGNA